MDYIKRRAKLDEKIVSVLEEKLGYRHEVCQALLLRGLDTPDKAKLFLRPTLTNMTPWQNYTNLEELRQRILRCSDSGEKVLIYGDYDCDGVCATAILYLLLQSLDIEVEFYLPNRKKEGYGLNREALEDIAEYHCPDLIITVDCGITAVEEIEYAQNELGLEIIVTDHHEPSDTLPDCLIIDPKVDRLDNCFNELCGAGIALRIAEAVGGVETMMMYMDIAALATIADIVPLINDNRIIVSHGLDIINAGARQSFKLLLDICREQPNEQLSAIDVAFKIVPKINAIGRLADSTKAVNLFISDEYFYAKSLVEQATQMNDERKVLTDELVRTCLYKLEKYDLINNKAIVLFGKNWETGVLGIAAAKMAEVFRRPAILLTYFDGLYKGSCRSVEGINLHAALTETRSYLESFGGHSMACGLSIKEENISSFMSALNICLGRLGNQPFLPKVVYDINVPSDDMDIKLIEDMSVLEPFGAGNPPVAYMTNFDKIEFDAIGKTRHIKAAVSKELDFVGFNMGGNIAMLNANANKNIVYTCNTRVYKNRKFAQGLVQDFAVDFATLESDQQLHAVKHLYQRRYPDKTVFKINHITIDEIDIILDKGIYGNLFVCYNEDTYKAFTTSHGDKFVFCMACNLKEVNPYNTLILGLEITDNLAFFNNIIFLDKPSSLGVIDLLKLKADCEICFYTEAEQGLGKSIEIIKPQFPSVPRMREIFIAMREVIVTGNLSRASQIYNKLCVAGTQISKAEFYIAFFALFEVGIIKLEGSLCIDKNVKTSLDTSKIYCGIKEEING